MIKIFLITILLNFFYYRYLCEWTFRMFSGSWKG